MKKEEFKKEVLSKFTITVLITNILSVMSTVYIGNWVSELFNDRLACFMIVGAITVVTDVLFVNMVNERLYHMDERKPQHNEIDVPVPSSVKSTDVNIQDFVDAGILK